MSDEPLEDEAFIAENGSKFRGPTELEMQFLKSEADRLKGEIICIKTDNVAAMKRYTSTATEKTMSLLREKERLIKEKKTLITEKLKITLRNTSLEKENAVLLKEVVRLREDNISKENARLSEENVKLTKKNTKLSNEKIELTNGIFKECRGMYRHLSRDKKTVPCHDSIHVCTTSICMLQCLMKDLKNYLGNDLSIPPNYDQLKTKHVELVKKLSEKSDDLKFFTRSVESLSIQLKQTRDELFVWKKYHYLDLPAMESKWILLRLNEELNMDFDPTTFMYKLVAFYLNPRKSKDEEFVKFGKMCLEFQKILKRKDLLKMTPPNCRKEASPHKLRSSETIRNVKDNTVDYINVSRSIRNSTPCHASKFVVVIPRRRIGGMAERLIAEPVLGSEPKPEPIDVNDVKEWKPDLCENYVKSSLPQKDGTGAPPNKLAKVDQIEDDIKVKLED